MKFTLDSHNYVNNGIISKKDYAFHRIILSPNKQKIATFDSTNFLNIIDFEKNENIAKIQINADKNSICFSFNEEKIAFFDKNIKKVHIADTQNLEIDKSFDIPQEIEELKIVFSKKNDNLAILYAKTLKILTKTGHFYQENQIENVNCMDFSPNDSSLLCYASSKTIFIDKFSQNLLKYEINSIEIESPILNLIFSSTKLLFSTENSLLFLFSLKFAKNSIKVDFLNKFSAHEKPPKFLLFSTDENHIFSCETTLLNSKVFLWKISQKAENPEVYQYEYPLSHAISLNNQFIAVSHSNNINIYDPNPNSLKPLHNNEKEFGALCRVFYSPKGDIFAKASLSNKISLFHTETGLFFKQLNKNKENTDKNKGNLEKSQENIANLEVYSMVFSNDSSKLVVKTKQNRLYIYEFNRSETPFGPVKNNCSSIKKYLMTKIGVLITAHEKGEISLFTGKSYQQKTFEKIHNSKIIAISLNYEENWLISGDFEGNIIIWDMNGKKIFVIKGENTDRINAFIITKNNEILFVSMRNKCDIWNLKKSYKIQTIIHKKEKNTKNLAISNDNNEILINKKHYVIFLRKTSGKYEEIKIIPSPFDSNIAEICYKRGNDDILIVKSDLSVIELNNSSESMISYQNEGICEIIHLNENKIFMIITDIQEKLALKIINWKNGLDLCEEIPLKNTKRRFFLLSADETRLLCINDDIYEVLNIEMAGNVINSGKISCFSLVFAYEKTMKNTVVFVIKNGKKLILWRNNQISPFEEFVEICEKEVICLDFSFDDKKLMILYNDRIIVKENHDFHQDSLVITQQKHEEFFEFGRFSHKDDKLFILISVFGKKSIAVFEGSQKTQEIQLNDENLLINPDFFIVNHNFLLFISKSKKNLFLTKINENYEKNMDFFNIIDNENGYNSVFINNNDDICLGSGFSEGKHLYKLEIYKDILKNPTFFDEKSNKLKSFFKEDFKGFPLEISPFNYNFLHILAYFDEFHQYYENLLMNLSRKNAIIPINYFFEKDIHGRSPFDTIFFTKNLKLFINFLNYITKNTRIDDKNYHYFNSEFFNIMIKILQKKPEIINKVLDFIYVKPFDFPLEFYHNSLKKPIFINIFTKNMNKLQLKHFLEEKSDFCEKNDGKMDKIEGKCLYCEELMDFNNKNTQEIFKSISNFDPNHEIFTNEAILGIIEYKWENYGKKHYVFQLFSFVIFLIIYLMNADFFFILRLNSSVFPSDFYQYSLSFDLIITLFLCKFTYNMVYRMNFSGFWDFCEILLIILGFFTTFCDIFSCLYTDEYDDFLKIMHAFTIFFGFLRLGSYGRGFEGSGFIMRLLLQVGMDIRYLLIVMLCFLVGIGFSGFLIDFLNFFGFFLNFSTFFKHFFNFSRFSTFF